MNFYYIFFEGFKNVVFFVFFWNRKNKINFFLKLVMESKSVLVCFNIIFKNIIILLDIDLFYIGKLVNLNCLIKFKFCYRGC